MRNYQDLIRDVLSSGEKHDDRTGVGTRSVFGRQWRHDMRSGFPLVTVKYTPLRWAAVELAWMLLGRSDVEYLHEHGVNIWDEWADERHCSQFGRRAGDLGPTYGVMWRSYPSGDWRDAVSILPRTCDQISQLLVDLRESPNSRRLIVNGWHPYWARQVSLPPCHTLWQVKVHEDGSMSLRVDARSIDLFLGFPFDVALYGLLLELLCAEVKRPARELIFHFGDLHLYESHLTQAREVLRREPRPSPRLELTVDSVHGFVTSVATPFKLHDYDPWPKIEAEVAV